MLAFLAIGLVIMFFLAYRLGLLDELPRMLGRRPGRPDPEETRRLEVFRDYIDDAENDE